MPAVEVPVEKWAGHVHEVEPLGAVAGRRGGVVVGGQTNKDAAWYYAEPSEAAKSIKDHVAFWRGVKVER